MQDEGPGRLPLAAWAERYGTPPRLETDSAFLGTHLGLDRYGRARRAEEPKRHRRRTAPAPIAEELGARRVRGPERVTRGAVLPRAVGAGETLKNVSVVLWAPGRLSVVRYREAHPVLRAEDGDRLHDSAGHCHPPASR